MTKPYMVLQDISYVFDNRPEIWVCPKVGYKMVQVYDLF